MIDTHTHSLFSHDGCQRIETMVKRAISLGIEYLAVTDHCDWDYLSLSGYESFRQLDLCGYLKKIENIKSKTEGIDLAIGLELGYHETATQKYLNEIPFDRLDYVINSVHSVGKHDVYFSEYFEGREKKQAYTEYLQKILRSIEVPYPYTTIGHIGYISKNSIYENKSIEYGDFADIIDMILKLIIDSDKTLEINSNIKTDISMPSRSILKRYRELGGENVVFASDAHKLKRLGEGYDDIKQLAEELGFKYWTIYHKLKAQKIKI